MIQTVERRGPLSKLQSLSNGNQTVSKQGHSANSLKRHSLSIHGQVVLLRCSTLGFKGISPGYTVFVDFALACRAHSVIKHQPRSISKTTD
jgi:hypothetical protein